MNETVANRVQVDQVSNQTSIQSSHQQVNNAEESHGINFEEVLPRVKLISLLNPHADAESYILPYDMEDCNEVSTNKNNPKSVSVSSLHYVTGCIHDEFGILILGTDSGHIRFFCLTTHHIILDITSHPDGITSLVLVNNSNFLLSSDKDGNICYWRMPKKYFHGNANINMRCWYRLFDDDNYATTKSNGNYSFDFDYITYLNNQRNTQTILCCDAYYSYVASGDTTGHIKIWKIVDPHYSIYQNRHNMDRDTFEQDHKAAQAARPAYSEDNDLESQKTASHASLLGQPPSDHTL